MVLVTEQSRHLAAGMRQATEAWRTLAAPLSAAQLAWTPPTGGWSVGQVLEHLVVVDGLYLQLCEALVARGTPATDAVWKPTLMGRLLARSVAPESKTRLRAPKAFRPGPTARPNALEAFMAMRERLATLVEQAAPFDWRRLKGPSPITPLVRLNLGDMFLVLVNHANRHLGQAQRIVAHEGFPRRAGA